MTKGLRKRVHRVSDLLEEAQGVPKWDGRSDALDTLIRTILSQNTNDVNRDKAYAEMRRRFPTWEDVMAAGPGQLASAIRAGGLAPSKSKYILGVLEWVQETFGTLNIDFICNKDPEWVVETFTSQKGIGIKTISVVLAFACGHDVFPVDTHVNRVCRRLGFVPPDSSPEMTFQSMRKLVPAGKSYPLHMNMIRLGRSTCKAPRPLCEKCPLTNECRYYRDEFSPTLAAAVPPPSQGGG